MKILSVQSCTYVPDHFQMRPESHQSEENMMMMKPMHPGKEHIKEMKPMSGIHSALDVRSPGKLGVIALRTNTLSI